MKILIVEDAFCMAMVLRDVLNAAGHQVTCVTGFNSLQPVRALGFDKLETDLDVQQFEIAFCDGQLLGNFPGPSVVEFLIAHGVKCIGMSTDPKINTQMEQKGASFGANKGLLIQAMFTGWLTIDMALEPTATLQDDLSHYIWDVLMKDKSMKAPLDEAVTRYLELEPK